jgi:hypothetical protein
MFCRWMEKRSTEMKPLLFILLLVIALPSAAQEPNTLSAAEKKDGWKLLFDGKSTSGWRKFKNDKIGAAWKVQDGALYLDANAKKAAPGEGGDIVTEGEYENFEFTIDWKIGPCGNSGIMFNVQEGEAHKWVFVTGPEMQVLDNECHPDAKINKHRAGDLYDLIACSTETVKPAGEWNTAKIVSKNGHYEFWLNGVKNVEFTMHTPEWDKMVAESKFKTMPDFGKFKRGRIALQDHGDPVWFRNIKIREIK